MRWLAALINSKMTKYLANDSPTPLSANLSEKQNNNQKTAILFFLQWASQKVLSLAAAGLQLRGFVLYPEFCMMMSPPRIQAPRSLFLKEMRVSMSAATRGLLGSEFSWGLNLRKQCQTMRNSIFPSEENVSASFPCKCLYTRVVLCSFLCDC